MNLRPQRRSLHRHNPQGRSHVPHRQFPKRFGPRSVCPRSRCSRVLGTRLPRPREPPGPPVHPSRRALARLQHRRRSCSRPRAVASAAQGHSIGGSTGQEDTARAQLRPARWTQDRPTPPHKHALRTRRLFRGRWTPDVCYAVAWCSLMGLRCEAPDIPGAGIYPSTHTDAHKERIETLLTQRTLRERTQLA